MGTLADILKPALRRAGITSRPGITPSADQYTELIAEANRLLQSWNVDGHRIFTTKVEAFTLTSGQKQYSIGPGGDFNTARPVYIKEANFIFPGTPAVRIPIQILDDDQWSKVTVQDISGAPPWYLYYDGSYDANGRAQIFIVGQPPAGYQLELYSWQALATFAASTDTVTWPPGYEYALETHLALCACSLYPLDSVIARQPRALALLEKHARQALDALITLNSSSPALRSEAAHLGGRGGIGMPLIFAGGGRSVNWLRPLVAPDGVLTTFTFTSAPIYCSFNGVNQFEGTGYNVTAARTVQFIDSTGAVITPAVGDDIRAEVN